MQVIYARQDFSPAQGPSIFLAGPTPRKSTVTSWRPEALEFLKRFQFDGTVFIPEDEGGVFCGEYDHQIEWEEEGLTRASCILFWFARSLPDMPGLVSNDEFGTWKYSGKIVVGIPDWAVKCSYQRYYAKKLNIPFSTNLKETILNAMDMSSR